MRTGYWRQFWASQANGQHSCQDEAFLQKEAKEKLFLLDGGESLLDFGCGSADLLLYFAGSYRALVGVDFSHSMLTNALRRLESHSVTNVTLVEADENSVWTMVPTRFDRITAGQVTQYLKDDQIAAFIAEAATRLTPDGKIILFDVIDPRMYRFWRAGMFRQRTLGLRAVTRLVLWLVKFHLHGAIRVLRGRPADHYGRNHNPALFEQWAQRSGLTVEVVRSMYYEYRYHVILTRTGK
jgi:cyclopropane-fatty-acyl-phospholipid synthase